MSELADVPQSWPTTSEVVYAGRLLGVRVDQVDFAGQLLTREVVTHPGAVAIVAVDADDRVLLLRQYRHPAERVLVELPAGLLDVAGEDPLPAAQRELAEEAGLRAERWAPLLVVRPSPGSSNEVVQVFLAEGLSDVPRPPGFTPHGEEATMTKEWVALDDLVAAVLDGKVSNGLTIAGSLALSHFRCEKGHSDATQST